MARRITRKELKRDEFVEATVDAGHWIERHWPTLAKVAGGVVVVALVAAAWMWNLNRNRERAGELLADATTIYREVEADGFTDTEALNEVLGLLDDAASKGGTTSVGRMAEYYRGATLYRLGRLDEAVSSLQRATEGTQVPPTLHGSATALLAEVHMAQGDAEQALQVLEGLISAEKPTYPVDQALLAKGKIHSSRGEMDQARRAWQRVVDEYPAQGAAPEARRLLEQ